MVEFLGLKEGDRKEKKMIYIICVVLGVSLYIGIVIIIYYIDLLGCLKNIYRLVEI